MDNFSSLKKIGAACEESGCNCGCPEVHIVDHAGGNIMVTDDNTPGQIREIFLKPEQVGDIAVLLLEALAEISPKDRMKAIEKIGEVLSPSEIGYFRTIGEPV